MDLNQALKQKKKFSCIILSDEDLRSWDYFFSTTAVLHTTEELFFHATRPFYEFYLEKVDYIGISRIELLDSIYDEFTRDLLLKIDKENRLFECTDAQIYQNIKNIIDKDSIWITTDEMVSRLSAWLCAAHLCDYVSHKRLLTLPYRFFKCEPEPTWWHLKQKMPSHVSSVILALDDGKIWLAPRFAERYNVPVTNVPLTACRDFRTNQVVIIQNLERIKQFSKNVMHKLRG